MGKSGKEKKDWFDEFKKLNKDSDDPPPPPPPPPMSPQKPPSRQLAAAPGGGKKERRHFARFEVDEANTTLSKEGLLSIVGIGKSNKARFALDLSEGGVRIMVTERLQPGTKVRGKIEMEKYNDAVEAAGEIRWCYQSAKKATDFFAGIQFIDLDAATRRKIQLMREWFTSPQYRQVRETKQRQRRTPSDIIQLPK